MSSDLAFVARFLSRIEVDTDSGCWLWSGSIFAKSGYGMTYHGKRRIGGGARTLLAHRVSYFLHVGPVPPSMVLDHLCRVRRCVNPFHLEPVSMRENVIRGRVLVTSCPKGHPLDGVLIKGSRYCKECSRIHARQYHNRMKDDAAYRERARVRARAHYHAARSRTKEQRP